MNPFTYIIIYLSVCVLIILIIPAVRNQWSEFITSIPMYYRRIEGDITSSKLKKVSKKTGLTLILGISICLFFIGTLVFLPFLIKNH